MRIALGLEKHHYLKRAGILLIVAAVVAGMLGGGCSTGGYDLTMLANPAGAGTATDETKGSPYSEGTIIDIEAEAETGYEFVGWTATAGTFGNADAASTIFAMPGEDVTVAANFVEVYELSIAASPAAGGTVTDSFNASPYAAGTVVSVQAVAAMGYRFVSWAGDVDTITDIRNAQTTVTINGDCRIVANFAEVQVGIRVGDWIKLEYALDGWPAGQPYPEWLKLEFLGVEGTTANVRATLHISDGTEQSDTMPVDIVAGGQALGFSGGVISANLTTGDSVYMTGYGDVLIEGEMMGTYAGANRTVLYAAISQSVPFQGEIQSLYCWDKLTGVIVESSTNYADLAATARATETNMW